MESKEIIPVATALQEAIAATISAQHIGNASFVTIPPGHVFRDISEEIEAAQLHPNRKQDSVTLKSLESFITLVKEQACEDGGYIYCNPDTRAIVAVFNDNRNREFGGWRDHRACFTPEFTPEFSKWMNHSGKPFAQDAFAEFIEDNFVDIDPGQAQAMLDMAVTIQATTAINFSSSKRLQDGQIQMVYNEVIDAKAGANGQLTIPREFKLNVRLFKQGEGYQLKARLKYTLQQGRVTFRFELDRPERSIEDAFAGYIKKLREESGYTVLLGTP